MEVRKMNVLLLLPQVVIKHCRERHRTHTATTEETETALKKLKNKVPETDNIPAELFKFGGVRLTQQL